MLFHCIHWFIVSLLPWLRVMVALEPIPAVQQGTTWMSRQLITGKHRQPFTHTFTPTGRFGANHCPTVSLIVRYFNFFFFKYVWDTSIIYCLFLNGPSLGQQRDANITSYPCPADNAPDLLICWENTLTLTLTVHSGGQVALCILWAQHKKLLLCPPVLIQPTYCTRGGGLKSPSAMQCLCTHTKFYKHHNTAREQFDVGCRDWP